MVADARATLHDDVYEDGDGGGVESAAGQEVRGVLPEGLADAIRTTAEDIAELLRGAPDTGAPVPGLTWTVGEVAAHLAQANALMAEVAAGCTHRHGDGTPQGIAEANERALAAYGERAAGPWPPSSSRRPPHTWTR